MTNLILSLFVVGALFSHSTPALAKTVFTKVEYKDGDTVLEGVMATDTRFTGKRPGVLVVHDWLGIGPNVTARLEKVAALGYTAFAADIYGKGVRPTNQKDAAATAGIYKKDRALMRRRATLAFEELKKQTTLVDTNKLIAIGYCFGGQTILELARSGAKAKGFVSFHGSLDTPTPQDAKNIQGAVLVFHGADDPFVPLKDVNAFEEEMRAGKVKWELVKYGNTVHSFTIPTAGSDPATGQAYSAEADAKSWEGFKNFLRDTL